MISIRTSQEWHDAWKGAMFGVLEISSVENLLALPELDDRKRDIERRLRERYSGFSRQEFSTLPVMAEYIRYYKRFEKTYHVLLQVESLVLKGKNLPSVSLLVDANFMAEVETLVLSAGHDGDKLKGDVVLDVAREGEQFVQMGGAVKTIPARDMIMRDEAGVCCSILYGQDDRSPITPETTHVLYVAYVPPGVPEDAVERHFTQITEVVSRFSPKAVVEQNRLLRS